MKEMRSSRTHGGYQQIEVDLVSGESGSFSNSEYEVVGDFVSTVVDGELEGKYRGGDEA